MEEFLTHIHFLRPLWLWAFAPLAIIALLLLLSTQQKEAWRSTIAKDILPYLIIKGDRISDLPKVMLVFLLSLMIVAVSGPTWEKVEKPGGKIEAALVILVDASRSMLAEDIAPNRLERAKQKISDLLDASPGSHIAVVAYAGTAHVLIPFTNDYKTIKYQLESLSPEVMPVMGTNLIGAVHLADSLLLNIEAPSTILVFTDDVTLQDLTFFGSRETSSDKVEYVALATPSGSSIPTSRGRVLTNNNGSTVIPTLNIENLKTLGKFNNVNITTVTLDNSDVKRLANNIKRNLIYDKNPEELDEDWLDAGYYLLFPIALIALFWFRRGWVVQWCIILFTGFAFSGCSNSEFAQKIEPLPNNWTFKDLWFTRDQQAQQLLDAEDYDAALELFDNPWQKAAILMHQGKLEDAAAIYSTLPTAEGYYNYGVIQAELKNWKTAQRAFENAVEANPNFKQAEENLAFVNETIAKLLAGYGKVRNTEDQNKPGGFSEEKDDLKELKDELDGDQEESNQGSNENADDGTNSDPIQENDDLVAQENRNARKQEETKDMILRQLSDDPAVFMQRKFKHQVLTGKVKAAKTENTW